MRGATHEEARERLEELALDLVDVTERGLLMAHVVECEVCARELDSLRRIAAALSDAVAPVPMPSRRRERVRARLLARATVDRHPECADLSGRPLSSARPRSRPMIVRAAWLAAAASLVALIGVGAMMRMIGERDRRLAALTGPDVAVLRLAAAAPRAASGMIFWDRARGDWTLVAHNLRMPRSGRGYQLWLVTPRAKISAGMFMPNEHGDAMMRAHYALSADSLAALAVTEEPSVGSRQPTTPPLMVATATR